MTNREWIINKIIKAKDKDLAKIFIKNQPYCSDQYGWNDNYYNPFNYVYLDSAYEERIDGEWSYARAERKILDWLQAEHEE